MGKYRPTLEDLQSAQDEPDLPVCVHCQGTVCVFPACTPDNHCPHGGTGVRLDEDRWACASKVCQEAAGVGGRGSGFLAVLRWAHAQG